MYECATHPYYTTFIFKLLRVYSALLTLNELDQTDKRTKVCFESDSTGEPALPRYPDYTGSRIERRAD